MIPTSLAPDSGIAGEISGEPGAIAGTLVGAVMLVVNLTRGMILVMWLSDLKTQMETPRDLPVC
jgi:hypothetical protein